MLFRHIEIMMLASVCLVAGINGVAAGQTTSPSLAPSLPTSLKLDRASPEIRILAAGSILTWAAFTRDDPEGTRAYLEGSPIEGLTDVGSFYGSAYAALSLTAGLAIAGTLGHRSSLTDAAVDLGKSLAVTGAIVWITKLSVNRTRPSGGSLSFPSGHTAVAFTTSTVLEQHFGWRVGIPAYAMAALTGLARMEDNNHFFSDVIAGATIGLLVGRIVPSRDPRSRVSAFADGDGVGLEVRF
jgi:membrane-associated phospholipid phosphatase